jgi:predicted GIY-YIG superfamily endonuclease
VFISKHQEREHLPTAVYRCYADDSTLLYVGVSLNPKRRISQHKACKLDRSAWTDRLAGVEVVWFENRTQAEATEREAIEKEGPVGNRRAGNYPPFYDLHGYVP